MGPESTMANKNDPFDTPEARLRRFNEGIYLTYVGWHLDNEFKHSTSEEFHKLHLGGKLSKITTEYFDKNNIHKLADGKHIWWAKNGKKLGEIWFEDGMKSYWINVG